MVPKHHPENFPGVFYSSPHKNDSFTCSFLLQCCTPPSTHSAFTCSVPMACFVDFIEKIEVVWSSFHILLSSIYHLSYSCSLPLKIKKKKKYSYSLKNCKHFIFKTDNQQSYCLAQGDAAWMGGESRGEWMHVYVWLHPYAVQMKPSQRC